MSNAPWKNAKTLAFCASILMVQLLFVGCGGDETTSVAAGGSTANGGSGGAGGNGGFGGIGGSAPGEDHSLEFDKAAGQIVDFANIAELSAATTYTIQAWAKLDVLANYDTIFAKRQADGDRAAMLQCYGNAGRLAVAVDNGYCPSSAPVVTTGEWYHLVVVYEGSQPNGDRVRLYSNGSRVALSMAAVPDVTPSSPTRFTVGAEYNGSTPINESSSVAVPMSGHVDDVAIWSTALGEGEIQQLYNSGAPLDPLLDSGDYGSSADLVAYWDFNDGAGNIVTDRVSAYDGTIVHGAQWSEDVP